MLTIKRAMELKVFKDAKIIAGKNNTKNFISSVTILEATNDEVVLWIKENELFLTSFYSIAEDEPQQLKILEMLHSKKSAGLVICSIGYWLKQISPSVINLADKLGLPLILMPPHITFYEILSQTMGFLLNQQSEKFKLALQIQSDLYSLLMHKKDINELTSYLGSIFEKTILYYDSDNQLVYKSKYINNLETDIVKVLNSKYSDDIYRNSKGTLIDNSLYFPMVSFGDYYGMLIFLNVNEHERENISLVVSHAVLTIMLISGKKKKMPRHDTWKLNVFMQDLLNEKFTNETDIYSRADELGLDLFDKHYLILISKLNVNLSVTDFESIKHNLEMDHIQNEIIVFDKKVILLVYNNNLNIRKSGLTPEFWTITLLFFYFLSFLFIDFFRYSSKGPCCLTWSLCGYDSPAKKPAV